MRTAIPLSLFCVGCALLCVVMMCLPGCGGGGSEATGDYLAYISTARWAGNRVTFRVHHPHSINPLEDREGEVGRGVALWSGALGDKLDIVPAGQNEDADIDFIFVSEKEINDRITRGPVQDVLDEINPQTRGWTEPSIKRGIMLHANCYLAQGMFAWQVAPAAAHECGHALGVVGGAPTYGHSPYRGDMMFHEVPTFAHLSARDRNTINAIYKDAQEPIRP